jgi:predicted flap endonuclease-1-like 5' DNA nuclease
MMTVNIRNFASINHAIVDQLWSKGFRTNEDILGSTATAEAREKLASDVGVSQDLVLTLARRADLARIKGIGNLYAELLEHAGVYSVPDLATQDVEMLYQQVIKLNETLKVTRRMPKIVNVQVWVETARNLESVVVN